MSTNWLDRIYENLKIEVSPEFVHNCTKKSNVYSFSISRDILTRKLLWWSCCMTIKFGVEKRPKCSNLHRYHVFNPISPGLMNVAL